MIITMASCAVAAVIIAINRDFVLSKVPKLRAWFSSCCRLEVFSRSAMGSRKKKRVTKGDAK